MKTEYPHHTTSARLVGWAVVCCLLLGAGGPIERARAQGEPQAPRAPRTLDEPAIALLPGLEPGAAEPAPDFDRAQTDAGKYAFQSYVDGNWEIYLTNSDYDGQSWRLTQDGSPDLEPALSPDMTRIVFTSRRSGNYDLYRMNLDGGGLLRLTDSGATDSGAAWSPDGRRIAFQSNREGNQYDVFVMDVDGGAVTRLTTQSGYDGEPAWSPDGSQIAFVSRRSTGNVDYYLYLMNADGSNQRILAAIPYTGNPSWSWDGRRILVDGLNAQGWQGIYIVDAVTGQTRSLDIFPGESNIDMLSGTWGMRDQIFITRVHYVFYNNVWYWDTMEIYSLTVDMGGLWRRQSSRMGYPSWSNPDRLPPVTTLRSTSTTYQRRQEAGWIDALAIDQGQAGVGWLEMQTRVDGGSWTDHSQRCSGQAPSVFRCFLPNVPTGALLEYRVRGVDGFLNTEQWPSDPAHWGRILYYDTRVTGTVHDQTGLPLARVPVTGITAHETPILSDAQGRWEAHQIGAGADVTVTVGSGGTAIQRPESAFALDGTTLTGAFYLPPSDNALVNPRFDSGLSGWAALSGADASWAQTLAGAQGVLRVSPSAVDWAATDTVSAATAAISGAATLLAYRDGSGNHFVACLGEPGCPVEGLGATTTRDLAVRADGTVGMVLMNDDGTRSFRQRNPEGIWSTAEDFPWMGGGASHRLLADGTGQWHYVWAEGDGMVHVARYEGGGVWSGAAQAGLMQLGSDYVFDADDVLHIVGCPTTGVVEVIWSAAVGMSSPSEVSNETCDGTYQGTSLDDAGRIDALWSSDGVVRFSRRAGDGTWGVPQPATGLVLAAQGSVTGPNGRATVLAVDPGTNDATLRQPAVSGSGWSVIDSTLPTLAGDGGRRFLALDLTARKAVVSETAQAGRQVMVYPLDVSDAVTRVGQVVTLPANLHRPLLSAAYRNPLAGADDGVALAVQGAGEAQPTLFPLAAGPTWRRVWFDVSAWAGQAITVSVQLTDGGAPNELIVDLDELYLGSWTTPVVGTLSPARVNTPASAFTLSGENFYGTPIVTVGGLAADVTIVDAEHLYVTLPPGVGYGWHTVMVTNPDGATTAAPLALQVGATQLTLPTMLRSAFPGWP